MSARKPKSSPVIRNCVVAGGVQMDIELFGRPGKESVLAVLGAVTLQLALVQGLLRRRRGEGI
jgi:hypothetical protein